MFRTGLHLEFQVDTYYNNNNTMRMFRATTIVNAAHAVGCRLIPCVLSHAGPIQHEIEDFVRGQIRQKLQIADGQVDHPLHLMLNHLLISIRCT